MLTYHGLADELIMPQGTVNYYQRVMSEMGGLDAVTSFYRLYLVPGVGHGSPNGTSNPSANPPVVPDGLMYELITDWVEKGTAPDRVDLTSPSSTPVEKSLPMCVYPKKPVHKTGSPFKAASYSCA